MEVSREPQLPGQDHHPVAPAVDPGELVEGRFLLELAQAVDRQVQVGKGAGGGIRVEGAKLPGVDAQAGRERVAHRPRGVIAALLAAKLRLSDRTHEVRVTRKTLHPKLIPPIPRAQNGLKTVK